MFLQRTESEQLTDEMHSLGQQMSCMRDCIASMFDEQAGLRSKTHAAVQLATTCENTVYRAPCYTPRESRDRCQCA